MTQPKKDANKKTTALYLVELRSGGGGLDPVPPQRLTNPPEGISDSSPVWLDDSVIAFISTRNEKQGTHP